MNSIHKCLMNFTPNFCPNCGSHITWEIEGIKSFITEGVRFCTKKTCKTSYLFFTDGDIAKMIIERKSNAKTNG